MSRNEPARERRRQLLKEQLSLRSIPLVESPKETYNLENHFGWKVMHKCLIDDGSFPPYLLHCIYCNKPNVQARDDGDHDKVMYVLYIRGQDGDHGAVDAKETQTQTQTQTQPQTQPQGAVPMPTAISTLLQSAPPVTPVVEKGKGFRRSPHRRRKIIGDFYYIPIKERVLMKYDIRTPTVPGNDGDVAGMGKVDGKTPKGERTRTQPKGWQLRAGAEYPEGNEGVGNTTDTDGSSEEESENEEEVERVSRIIEYLRKYDCSDCFARLTKDVELLESPSEKNKYLYLRKERYEKRPLNISDQETGNDYNSSF